MIERLLISDQTEPCNETCPQIGDEDYRSAARKNGQRYIAQLTRILNKQFGEAVVEASSLSLYVKGNLHDFGTYYTIEARWEGDDEKAEDMAYWLEGNLPEVWDDENAEVSN